ncbi:MAG: sulfite exporter TauE/SafE family protein [bacterium]|nr:sulfite exporter TauE/SafE family protein [bacterium]
MEFPVSGVEVFPLIPPLVAFVIAFFSSMGGVSGAFLLLPFQVSFLNFTSPAVSSTNMVYNIIAIPSGVYRYIRDGKMAWPLAWVIILGTLPGVFIGVYFRIKYFPDPKVFKFFVGIVLLYIALQLIYQSTTSYFKNREAAKERENDFRRRVEKMKMQHKTALNADMIPVQRIKTISLSLTKYEYEFWDETHSFNPTLLFIITFFVGIIGGIYGIGGGSIVAPFCIAVLGLPVYTIAGAVLLGTFLTSIVGIAYFYYLASSSTMNGIPVTPDWALGIMFGIGGLLGMYYGAKMQKYVPEKWIKIILGLAITYLSVRYIVQFF